MINIDILTDQSTDEKLNSIEIKNSTGFGQYFGSWSQNKNYRRQKNAPKMTPKSHSCAPFICGDVLRVTEESEDV